MLFDDASCFNDWLARTNEPYVHWVYSGELEAALVCLANGEATDPEGSPFLSCTIANSQAKSLNNQKRQVTPDAWKTAVILLSESALGGVTASSRYFLPITSYLPVPN